jgi:hypothetical protein
MMQKWFRLIYKGGSRNGKSTLDVGLSKDKSVITIDVATAEDGAAIIMTHKSLCMA